MGRTKRKGEARHSSHRVHSAFVCPERPSLSTEPASAPKLVRCYHESRLRVNEKCHFGTQAAWESAGRNHSTLARATDANFAIHCLFTVIHCSLWRRKIANFRNPLPGRRLRGSVRCSPPLLEKIRC